MRWHVDVFGWTLLSVAVAFGAACGDPPSSRSGAEGTGGSGSIPPEASGESADPMEAQLVRLTRLPTDSLLIVMPAHRQMVANMLAQMNREMAAMNMGADANWSATVDSVRNDLTTMRTMSAAGIAALIPAHVSRVRRLMAMHASMMRM